MGSLQIVFLFDLNSFNDYSSFSRQRLNKNLQDVRLACLRILTEFSTKTSNLRWGFKFFDSYGSITQTMPKLSFSDVSLENFETLESEICTRYERHVTYSQALAESSQNNIILTGDTASLPRGEKNSIAPVKLLHLALTQILGEFQWEYIDMLSPSIKRTKNNALCMGKRNFLFLFANVKDDDDMLLNYFGLTCFPSKSKFANILLPQTLHEQLLDKANIHWAWLNVCQEQKFLGAISSRILPLLSETLQSFKGSLIPLPIFTQSQSHMKLLNSPENTVFENEISAVTNLYGSFHNSLLPFSAIFRQALHYPFYSGASNLSHKCCIVFADNNAKVPVQIMKILEEKHNSTQKDDHDEKENNPNSTESKSSDSITFTWSTFVIQGAVSANIKFVANDTLLCLPNDPRETSSAQEFMMLNKTLCLKGLKLVLMCKTDSGLQMPGLFSPLSDEAAVISILDPIVSLIHRPDFQSFDRNCMENASEKLENIIKKFKTQLESSCTQSDVVKSETDSTLKPFQMECLEVWFKPTPAVSRLAKHIQSKQRNNDEIESFHKLLQKSYSNKYNVRASSSKEALPNISGTSLNPTCQTNECEISFDNLEDLISATKDIYNSAIESSGSVLDGAKKIMKLVANYFKKHCGPSFEDDVQNFMLENILMTGRRICEKHKTVENEDQNKKIKEFQIQIFLNLELEGLILPSDKSNCVNSVAALVRLMTFSAGAPQMFELLRDILKKNYSHLSDVLFEIGEELDIPTFDETESSDSPDALSSELVDGELLSSVLSSDVSERSSLSVCSQKDNNRKLVRHRSDISDTTIHRQVLLPGASPKKKKGKSSAQRRAIRCSPRLASRKEKLTKTEEAKQKTARRNLFSKDKLGRTPKKNKNEPTTPKNKKNPVKTKFVAETPSHKQNHSAFQRRKSFVEHKSSQDLPKEVAESPQIMKNAKNDANKELLQKLKRISNEASLKPVEEEKIPSFIFTKRTPESKRRLSLKLFSKLLASPTARMGMKKCTKRLFDEISPQKSVESSKKYRPCEESKLVLNTAAESKSHLDVDGENGNKTVQEKSVTNNFSSEI